MAPVWAITLILVGCSGRGASDQAVSTDNGKVIRLQVPCLGRSESGLSLTCERATELARQQLYGDPIGVRLLQHTSRRIQLRGGLGHLPDAIARDFPGPVWEVDFENVPGQLRQAKRGAVIVDDKSAKVVLMVAPG